MRRTTFDDANHLFSLTGEKPAAMQHGSRSHSSRLVPSCSGSLLFVTGLVVFLLTTWLATTNQSQQNLLYFEQHEPHLDDHQNKQEHEQRKQQRRQKRQRKVLTAAEHKPEKNHWQTNYHQFYLQLLRKISEKFGEIVHNGSGSNNEKKGNSPHTITTTGEEAHLDIIKNDTHSVTKILCILFLLEVNRRAVEISCKSNLKKPQAKSCLDGFFSTNTVTTTATTTGSFRKATIIKSSSNPTPASATAIHHFHHHHPYSVLGKYSLLKNNAYEHCVPRQVVSVGKKENETMLGDGRSAVAQVAPSVDDIIKVDQDHDQNHVHASLVSGGVAVEKDIEEKRIVTLMISTLNKRRHAKDTIKINKERIYYHSRKWDSQRKVGPESVDDYNSTAFKPKFCGSFQQQRRNICVLEKMKEKVGENFANEFRADQALECAVAPGVAAIQRVTGNSKSRRLSMVTTFSSSSAEISPLSSASFVLSPCTSTKVSYPMAYKRFIMAITANNPPTITRSPLLSPQKKGNFKVDTLVFCIVTPVLVIIVVLTIIIIRKEVDSSLHRHHHHHHFTVLFPSACSYYYNSLTTTTSGLLVSCFPFLLISSSSTFLPALVATAPRLIPTTTTSFQPLFCLRNKAEEDGDCLPQLLVKRLVLQQPKTPPTSLSSSQPPEYYSTTVPTTNNNSNNHTCKLRNILDFTMKQTAEVAVR